MNKKSTKKSANKSKAGNFLLFVGPSILTFTCVLVIPFLYGIYLTFTDYSPITRTAEFVGLTNFISVFKDKTFIEQFGKTIMYVIVSTILCNLLAFVLAYVLTKPFKNRNFIRTGFFIPNLIGGIILGYIWKFIFSDVLTAVGRSIGSEAMSTSFLTDPNKALWAMIIVTVWQYAGYLMIIYIAGLVGIPKDIEEAAELDNATGFRKIFNVTIPLMVPSFIVCFFITISRCFMTYDLNLALTAGGPFGSTRLASMHIYQKAFQSNKYGQGQAEAIMLFLMVAIFAVTQVILAKKYEVEA